MNRITIHPAQCSGRPCIRGMRIRVKDVLDMLADGASEAEILADFPDLEAADIPACIGYAAGCVEPPAQAGARPAVEKLSWEETAKEMAASDEDWSDVDTAPHPALDEIPWEHPIPADAFPNKAAHTAVIREEPPPARGRRRRT